MSDQQKTNGRNKILFQVYVLKVRFIPIRLDFDWRGKKEGRCVEINVEFLYFTFFLQKQIIPNKKIKTRPFSFWSHLISPVLLLGKSRKKHWKRKERPRPIIGNKVHMWYIFFSPQRAAAFAEKDGRGLVVRCSSHIHTRIHTYLHTYTHAHSSSPHLRALRWTWWLGAQGESFEVIVRGGEDEGLVKYRESDRLVLVFWISFECAMLCLSTFHTCSSKALCFVFVFCFFNCICNFI